MSIAFLVQLIPTLLLIRNYLLINRNDILSFYEDRRIEFFHDGRNFIFDSDDIETLTWFKSYAFSKNITTFVTINDFYYGIIKLKNGTRIIVSSLLFNDSFKLPISENKVRLEVKMLRWVKGPSLQLP